MLNNDSTAYGAQETMTIPNSETSQSPASIPTAGDYYCNLFPGLNRFKENVSVRCIFHQDNSPSLSLNLRNGTFNCFGCKTKAEVSCSSMLFVKVLPIRKLLRYSERKVLISAEPQLTGNCQSLLSGSSACGCTDFKQRDVRRRTVA